MKPEEKKKFSIRKRLSGTNHAARGIGILLRYGHTTWVFLIFTIVPLYLGWTLHISTIEWLILLLAYALLITLEAINTAIEIDIDLTSPTYHPYARDTKDVAAGAVMLAAIFGCIVAASIFLPKIFALL